jgi:hypothetical protein
MDTLRHKVTRGQPSLADRLAEFFRARPRAWINGLELSPIAGAYAWRSRTSDLRRAPHFMTIENRQRRVRRPDGTSFTVSEYRFMPEELRTEGSPSSVESTAWRFVSEL